MLIVYATIRQTRIGLTDAEEMRFLRAVPGYTVLGHKYGADIRKQVKPVDIN
jgi:hypothetical protein